jgi:hypothetical protein
MSAETALVVKSSCTSESHRPYLSPQINRRFPILKLHTNTPGVYSTFPIETISICVNDCQRSGIRPRRAMSVCRQPIVTCRRTHASSPAWLRRRFAERRGSTNATPSAVCRSGHCVRSCGPLRRGAALTVAARVRTSLLPTGSPSLSVG